MRREYSVTVEAGRVRSGAFASKTGAKDGAFFLRCPATGERLKIIVSDGNDWAEAKLPGEPFEHVSVSCENRCPFWSEMAWVKDQFFDEDETVMQLHPAKANYVNTHEFCLHLWKPSKSIIPTPPLETV